MRHALKIISHGDREVVMTRTFDAPRNLVFDALTVPELIKRWLGTREGWTLDVCEIDLRVGGTYRYLWRGPDGMEMGMGGVYREIVRPERIVTTEKFDVAWYPGEGAETVELTEENGQTTLTLTVRYDTTEARDIVLASPMESGMADGYNALDGVLASMLVKEDSDR